MKLKEYFNSFVLRRKSNAASKSHKPKSHHQSISSTDCHYEVCEYEDINKPSLDSQLSRTQVLLTRHAQLVDTIVGIRSQENLCSTCPHCRVLHQSQDQNLFLDRNYSNTLATCNPRRESQNPSIISSSNNSLWKNTRQRSKIRTNPWINSTRISQPEYSIYEQPTPSTLIHSESFPQTIFNGNIHSIKPSTNKILHQSDSGHGFSLSSSKIVDTSLSSSSSDNTSNDGFLIDDKQHIFYGNHIEKYFPSKSAISSSDRKQRINKSAHPRYQRSTNPRLSSPKRTTTNRNHPPHNMSPRLLNDRFSIEFEEMVENEYANSQSPPTQKSPFILPLDETNVKLSSPLPLLYSTSLKKTNSRTILKHIEEIENEIQMIKNLSFDQDESSLTSTVYTKEDARQVIHHQVDQWVEECLTTAQHNSTSLLHNECNSLSNTMKDYVDCVYSNDNDKTSDFLKPEKETEIMTAFYLTSMPPITRTLSNIDHPSQRSNPQTIRKDLNFLHECPF